MSRSAPRTLADQFRSWPDDALSALLRERPDLAVPAPQDSTQLASRASGRASVLRALDQLDRLELTVLDAVVALGGQVTLDRLCAAVAASGAAVQSAVGRLRCLALVWGPDDELRAVSAVADTLGTTVSGLGPSIEQLMSTYGPSRVAAVASELGLAPSGDRSRDVAEVAQRLSGPEVVARLVQDAGPQAQAILDHLERTGKEGIAEGADEPVSGAGARTPAQELLAHGLLVARDHRHVAVPREVAMALRGGRTTRERVDQPPALATASRTPRLVDRAAAGAAYELVRHVELLLERWGTDPPAALRSGGVGVRDLRAAAALLHLSEPVTALHVETAAAAGLVAVGSTEDLDAAWLPTDAFDVFLSAPVAERWARLATAWLDNARLTGLVGSREAGKPVNALAPDLERSWLAETRRGALTELATLPAGRVLAPATGVASLVERLRWLRPRRPASRSEAVAWAVEEAAVVGVLGLGGMSAHGRALVAGEGAQPAARALEPLLPEPVDHVLIQADLTAVAPGPLEQQLAHDLALVADVESRGGATVYRFTESSVRRAFDVGWSAAEVHERIASASRTEVPQPLRYLVDDVARTFGTVRVGAAESFLRSEDEAALAALVHDARAAPLRLRRIAPTVVVSDVPVDLLLPRLRELGMAPVLETAEGTLAMTRRDAHRARTPKPRPDPSLAARAGARVAATVAAIRAGDQAAEHRPPGPGSRPTPMSAMATLRQAAESGATVWIGYLDNDGSRTDRVVDPTRVEGGWLRAYDHRTQDVRSFAIHRITGVRELAGEELDDLAPAARHEEV